MGERSQIALAKAGRPGVYLVDSFPWLKHIPSWFLGAGFKRDAKEFQKDLNVMAVQALEEVKKKMREGIARDCIAANCLRELESEDDKKSIPAKEEDIKAVLGNMYIAGADTVSGGSAYPLDYDLFNRSARRPRRR